MPNDPTTGEQRALYLLTLEVSDVPAAYYREHGAREIAYTQGHMRAGTIRELFVTPNRKTSYLLVQVGDESEISQLIEGFPLRPYIKASYQEVRDVGAQVRAAQGG